MAIVTAAPVASTVAESAAPPARLEFIEGLRALAALWVVLSHIWISQFGLVAHTGVFGLASNWMLYSHLAVDVFIVLSGFCLTLPVRRSEPLRGGARGFWRRRARRILPPYYCALALSVVVSLLLRRLDIGLWQMDFRALGVNLLLVQDLVPSDNVFNGPFWSIAVECHIYLLFPLLAGILRRRGLGALLAVVAALGYGLTALIFGKAPSLLMACPWYLLLFGLGMCAAYARGFPLSHRRFLSLSAGAALLLVLLLRAYPVTAQNGVAFGLHMPVIDAAVGALTALLLLGLTRASGEPGAVGPAALSRPWLVGLGRFSYSLYLTHEPLLRVLERLLSSVPKLETAAPLWKVGILAGAGLPLLIAVAYLFFLACERPFLSASRSRVIREKEHYLTQVASL